MRRFSRGVALVAVGAALAPALALAGAFPAGAATVTNYEEYRQTIPGTVIDDLDLTDEEKAKLVANTRTGVVGDKTVVPLKQIQGPNALLIGGLAGQAILYIDGALQNEIEYSRDMPRPAHIPADEWDACALSGSSSWFGDFFNGARDWVASFQGTDCNDVRAGWDVEKDPDYQPIGAPATTYGFPASVRGCNGSGTTLCLTATALVPFWSSVVRSIDGVTRQEGWVYPFERTSAAGVGPTAVTTQWAELGPGGRGTLTPNNISLPIDGTGTSAVQRSLDPRCNAFSVCVVASLVAAAYSSGTLPTIMIRSSVVAPFGVQTATIADNPPYIDPVSGTPSTGELARQVLLTTVTGASGATYQCRTVSFVETAPTIPRPCEPEVPDWDEIVKRIVEVVPETDTGYVPGSNPSRGVTTTEVPEVVRDWQAERDPADKGRMDLRKIGLGSCFDYPEACLEWFEQEDKDAKYECYDGSRKVSLADCVKYARLFKPGAIAGGTPYPGPGQQPGATPGTQTGPGVGTAPGGGLANPEQTRNCWAGMISWNPLDWVFTPVKCALEWAFVPRQSYVNAQIRLMQAKWTGSSLVSLLGVLEQGQHLMLSGSGCAGPHVSLNIMGGEYSGNPLSACSAPMDGVATFSRIFTMVSAWAMAVASIARSVAGVVGFTKLGGD